MLHNICASWFCSFTSVRKMLKRPGNVGNSTLYSNSKFDIHCIVPLLQMLLVSFAMEQISTKSRHLLPSRQSALCVVPINMCFFPLFICWFVHFLYLFIYLCVPYMINGCSHRSLISLPSHILLFHPLVHLWHDCIVPF